MDRRLAVIRCVGVVCVVCVSLVHHGITFGMRSPPKYSPTSNLPSPIQTPITKSMQPIAKSRSNPMSQCIHLSASSQHLPRILLVITTHTSHVGRMKSVSNMYRNLDSSNVKLVFALALQESEHCPIEPCWKLTSPHEEYPPIQREFELWREIGRFYHAGPENHFDWVARVDDDTIVNVAKMQRLFAQFNSEHLHFFGYRKFDWFCDGPAIFTSARTVRELHKKYITQADSMHPSKVKADHSDVYMSDTIRDNTGAECTNIGLANFDHPSKSVSRFLPSDFAVSFAWHKFTPEQMLESYAHVLRYEHERAKLLDSLHDSSELVQADVILFSEAHFEGRTRKLFLGDAVGPENGVNPFARVFPVPQDSQVHVKELSECLESAVQSLIVKPGFCVELGVGWNSDAEIVTVCDNASFLSPAIAVLSRLKSNQLYPPLTALPLQCQSSGVITHAYPNMWEVGVPVRAVTVVKQGFRECLPGDTLDIPRDYNLLPQTI